MWMGGAKVGTTSAIEAVVSRLSSLESFAGAGGWLWRWSGL